MSKLIEVYSAANSPEAHLLVSRLADDGIPARIVGEALGTGAGELPVGYATSPRIWVHEEHAERARDLVLDWEEERKDSRPEPSWKCPACAADVDGSFQICWSCQQWREDVALA
ncbi:MAG: DUF2007 domain-containing protein [Planctomycetaceae bacterium]